MCNEYLIENPITLPMLQRISSLVPARAAAFIPWLNAVCAQYEINTRQRIAMFLAQLLHESDRMRTAKEYWGPTPAQRRYEGRKDLGNTQPGDGYRFLGRGLIQTTGRSNYAKVSRALGVDFVTNPALLESPEWAVKSAGYYWNNNKLNTYADADRITDCTKAINGGVNGLEERKQFWRTALAILP